MPVPQAASSRAPVPQAAEPRVPVPQAASSCVSVPQALSPRAPVPQASSTCAFVPQSSLPSAPVPQAPASASACPASPSASGFPFVVAAPPCTSFGSSPIGSRPLRFRPATPAPASCVVPAECLHLCSSLATAVRLERAQRAWDAGVAAGRLLSGEIDCVPPTPEITVKSRIYVVLRNPRGSAPAVYHAFSAYKRAVGALLSGSVCHGFPTQKEARTYCKGSGCPYPSDQ